MFWAFAMTLQFYSARAYLYVQRKVVLGLPDLDTIWNLFASVDCQPGFTQKAFAVLRWKAEEDAAHGAPLYNDNDDMKLKAHMDLCGEADSVGCVDYGTEFPTIDTSPLATDVLVLIADAVNAALKIPLGYHFIAGTSGKVWRVCELSAKLWLTCNF